MHQAYSILADPETKKLYDSGDKSVLLPKPTTTGKWERYITPLTSAAIECAREKYQGSDNEEKDILREFVIGKGSMTHLLNTIPFMRIEDEPRIIHMLNECMQSGNLQKLPIRKVRR